MKAVKFGTRYAESRGSVLFGWTNLLICCINTTPSAAVTQRLRAGCLSWLSSTVHLRHVSQNRLPASIGIASTRSEEHTSELQSRLHLVCRLLLEKKKKKIDISCQVNSLSYCR